MEWIALVIALYFLFLFIAAVVCALRKGFKYTTNAGKMALWALASVVIAGLSGVLAGSSAWNGRVDFFLIFFAVISASAAIFSLSEIPDHGADEELGPQDCGYFAFAHCLISGGFFYAFAMLI